MHAGVKAAMDRDMSERFEDALAQESLLKIRQFEKADLHCHSIFGARLWRVEKWANVTLERPPSIMGVLDDMRSYAHRVLFPHISNKAGFEFTAEASILDSLDDGVTVLEMSVDVSCIQLYNQKVEELLWFIERIVGKYRDRIDFRPEIGIARDADPSPCIQIALEWIRSGIFKSIDLYGNEMAQPPDAYKSLYKKAKLAGLKLKAHVGEFGGPEIIEQTFRLFELNEIQHGVKAASSSPLMKLLSSERVRLNVCPSSNVALSVAPSLAEHPIKILVDNGVRVSINSDDLTIFNSSVSEEYLKLWQAEALTAHQLETIRKDSLVN
jgi:adenosine deaminase